MPVYVIWAGIGPGDVNATPLFSVSADSPEKAIAKAKKMTNKDTPRVTRQYLFAIASTD